MRLPEAGFGGRVGEVSFHVEGDLVGGVGAVGWGEMSALCPVAVIGLFGGIVRAGGAVAAVVALGEAEMGADDVLPRLDGREEEFATGLRRAGKFPQTAGVDAAFGVHGRMAGPNALDDKLGVWAVDDLGVGAGEGGADVFDEFGGGEESGLWGAELGEAGLVGLPEGDLGDVAVCVLFEASAQPVAGAVWFFGLEDLFEEVEGEGWDLGGWNWDNGGGDEAFSGGGAGVEEEKAGELGEEGGEGEVDEEVFGVVGDGCELIEEVEAGVDEFFVIEEGPFADALNGVDRDAAEAVAFVEVHGDAADGSERCEDGSAVESVELLEQGDVERVVDVQRPELGELLCYVESIVLQFDHGV